MVIPGGHILTADKYLAVRSDLYFGTGNWFADRSFLNIERVAERNDGGRLCKSVALDDRESHAGPELLEFFRQRCCPNHKRPKSPSQRPMHPAVSPPAGNPVTRARRRISSFRE